MVPSWYQTDGGVPGGRGNAVGGLGFLIGFQAATMFTSFLGRTMTFRMVLPSRKGFTLSEALAAASRSAWEAVAGTLMTSRSLPLTWTGISSVSSTSKAASNFGHAA